MAVKHIQRLGQVLRRFRSANLKIDPTKMSRFLVILSAETDWRPISAKMLPSKTFRFRQIRPKESPSLAYVPITIVTLKTLLK